MTTPALQPEPLALAAHPEPSAGQLLKMVLESPNPETKIDIIERMVAMKERADAAQAQRDFALAFHRLQSAMPAIAATEAVPDKHGNTKYHFAPYAVIMEQVRPLLITHGFTVRFDSEFKEARMVVRCTLTHVGGHSETSTQFMRVGSVFGANDAQNDGATITMAKRYALCQALNIVIDHDTDGRTEDARNEGHPISHEQAVTLRELVKETGSDEVKFLAFAQAKTYDEIGTARYQELFRTLQNKLTRK